MVNPKDFGKGAVKNKFDFRDFRLEVVAQATPLPEEYSIRDKVGKIKNQNGSLSCVAQAFAYYAEVLNFIETGKKIELSARDIYSLTFLQNGGSYLRDAAKKITNSGVVTEEDLTSYENGNPPSEVFMRTRSDATPEELEEAMIYWAKSFVTWKNNSFDWFKQAIYTGNGAVIAAYGNDFCWKDAVLQTPDTVDQCPWAHGVYCTGWKKINGEEHLEFANEWGEGWGDKGFGFMPKLYIDRGYVFNPLTLIDLPNGTYDQMQSQIFKLMEQIKAIIDAIKKKYGLQ